MRPPKWTAASRRKSDANITYSLAHASEAVLDVLTVDFLKQCRDLADAHDAVRKQQEDLWLQVADKLALNPTEDLIRSVRSEISIACCDDEGQFRENCFGIEWAFLADRIRQIQKEKA